ncbi:HdeD family acid-resistance protein [Dactylosporangium sp. CA-139114]|uniref:HdeD family acid-resistance protein n=1 Tax=Dactylosporangium sp. CA-139114 TaxID=3239931 RepID=UPI003D98AAFF
MTTTHWYQRRAWRHSGSATAAEPVWQVMILGAVTVCFGIVVLVWPGETLRLLGLATGVWLIVAGATRAFAAFDRDRGATHRVLAAVVAVMLVAAGVACLRSAEGGERVLAALIGLSWLVSGFVQLTVAMLASGPVRTWLAILGGVSAVAGLVFILWPGPSLMALILLTGISALLIGAGEIGFALRLRSGGKHAVSELTGS